MGTTYQFKLKIKIRVTKSKKLKSEVAIRENVEKQMPKNWKTNRKQKYLQTCVKNRNNVCKIINNVQNNQSKQPPQCRK